MEAYYVYMLRCRGGSLLATGFTNTLRFNFRRCF